MAVAETLRGLGGWGLQIKPNIPDNLWKAIDYFGHIVVHTGPSVDPRISGDSLLKSSRYTGVLRSISETTGQKAIGGLGVAMWLGDPDSKSDIIEDLLEVDGSFQDVIEEVMDGFDAVTIGTIFNIAETYAGSFQFQSRREIVDYICQTVGAAWRVNGDATLDAGLESDLFVTNPKMLVVRKRNSNKNTASADDMFLRALSGELETGRDVEDFTTRLLLMAQGSGGQFASATADIDPGLNPYKDLYGNPVKMTRIVQESETDPTNAPARAQLQLNRFSGTRDALTLNSNFYDIKGDAQIGDYVGVFDPAMGLLDYNNEKQFRSERINPINLKLTEASWPVTKKMSVFYRDYLGEWYDLTPHVIPESGDTILVVGGYNRSLSDGGSGSFPITPPEVDTTIPGETEWDLPFNQSMYQSPVTGESRSEVELKWFKPNNTNDTPMADLSHYEMRYRANEAAVEDLTIDDVGEYTLDELDTVDEPIEYGGATSWQYATAPGDVLRFRLQELVPSMSYEAQIRAVDTARPANLGAWSDLIGFQMSRDIIPPAVPAAPIIVANPMAVLMEHHLGRADGGEFNLDRDLHHLELHSGTSPIFQTTIETLIGKVLANWGMITGEIPIVASFQITTIGPQFYKVVAVDQSGNKSMPSIAVEQTADLIDNQYVRNLVVDKVTAGTISADWIVGGYIRTAKTGARVEMSFEGIHGYNSANERLLDWNNETGKLHVQGKGGIEIQDGALRVLNAAGDVIVELGECSDGRHGLQVFKDNGARVARIGELESVGGEGIEFVDDLGKLVRANTLAFGTNASTVTGVGTLTPPTGFQDLPGSAGPVVSVTVGNSGRAIVIVSSWILANNLTLAGQVSFDCLDANGVTTGASQFRALAAEYTNSSSSRLTFVTGLPAGNTTFTLKYRATGNGATYGNVQFVDRHLFVIPF